MKDSRDSIKLSSWPCWFLCLVTLGMKGHAWVPIRRNVHKSVGLANLHTWAGYDCLCVRCGHWWLDYD